MFVLIYTQQHRTYEIERGNTRVRVCIMRQGDKEGKGDEKKDYFKAHNNKQTIKEKLNTMEKKCIHVTFFMLQ